MGKSLLDHRFCDGNDIASVAFKRSVTELQRSWLGRIADLPLRPARSAASVSTRPPPEAQWTTGLGRKRSRGNGAVRCPLRTCSAGKLSRSQPH